MPSGRCCPGHATQRDDDDDRAKEFTPLIGFEQRVEPMLAASASIVPARTATSTAGFRILTKATGSTGVETIAVKSTFAKPARRSNPAASRPAHGRAKCSLNVA